MKVLLHASLILLGIAAVLAVGSYLALRLEWIETKRANRFAVLVASLTAASVLKLTLISNMALTAGFWDVLVWFSVLWFFSFFVFWAGAALGAPKFTHEDQFEHSSILSMQYLDSIEGADMFKQADDYFEATQRLFVDGIPTTRFSDSKESTEGSVKVNDGASKAAAAPPKA